MISQDSSLINQDAVPISNQLSALQPSVASSQSAADTLANQLPQYQSALATQAELALLVQASLRLVQGSLVNMSSAFNSDRAAYLSLQAEILAELASINDTLGVVSGRVGAISPAASNSTLTVVTESYNAASNTLDFNVRNNLNVIVYAQFNAVLYGTGLYPCDGSVGTYTSQLYQFQPGSVTTTTLSLSQVVYNGCGKGPVVSVALVYTVPESVQVSASYAFDVSPPYNFA